MKSYEALANAVIAQAARDYRRTLKVLRKNPNSRAGLANKKELEKFFHSDYYRILTTLDADYLMERVKKEVESR